MPDQSYAQIVFSLPLDRAYTYSIPEELRDNVKRGVRVTVPLRKHISTGYVVDISAETPDRDIKSLYDVLDPEPLFDDNLLWLTRWIADYYLCSWGQALDCALPPGVRLTAESHIALVSHKIAEVNEILAGLRRSAPRQYEILKVIVAEKQVSIAKLQKRSGTEGLYGAIAALEKRGVITREAVIKSGAQPRKVSAVRLAPDLDAEGATADISGPAPKQAAILRMLLERGEMLAGELARATGSSYAAIHSLEKKGFVELFTKEILRGYPEDYIEEEAGIRHILTAEQRVSLDLINGYVEVDEFKTILLEGVTGSGKTEVYLQAIELALKRGKGAIVLVPEIALTPQTVARFRARFGDSVAVMHSRLSAGERYDEWRQIRSGFYNIVVGARSAIFAPVRNLGLIVVDEEHEASYKQGETPRYNGRDVAIMRAHDVGATVILGTATPSLETFYNVEVGKYERTELSARVLSQPLPEVRLVDLREARRGQTVETILSDELCFKIEEKLGRGEQVIIFLNRRGYTPFFLCAKCGVPVGCPHCSVALTYHATENRMKCHYCGSIQQVTEQCPHCGNTKLAKFGTGTERVEEELENTFPKARIRRMDADTTSTKGSHEKILKAFRGGDVDILVGTQMLAKGLDFPRVTLVGVVLADVAINLPDFRAAERTFQLLMQVSGRSGRSHLGGEVIIQAYNPNHYAVQAARKHDFHEFYRAEMQHRRKSEFPPCRHLMNVLIDATSQKDGQQVVRALAMKPKELEKSDGGRMLKVLGPAPAPMSKIKGRYRFRFLMLSSDTVLLRSLGREIIDSHRRLRGTRTRLTVDMDALSML